MLNVSMAISLLNGHLRSGGTSIPTPSHPELASHNWSSNTTQCSWKGGKASPGFCSREEGQHRRKVVVGSILSSGNNKSLQVDKVGWAGLTPVVGSAAQAWLYLFSGSWGSSLTNPLTLYLWNMFGDILEILHISWLQVWASWTVS